MSNYNELFQRNIGIFSESQQIKIKGLRIAIAGLGGVGGITAERLARLGVGHMNLCDPESFEYSNANRQIFSNAESFGKNKAAIFASELKKINHDIDLQIWTEDLDERSLAKFINADIIINGIEYNLLEHSIALHKASRNAGIVVLAGQAIGLGATVFAFDKDNISFEEYIGLHSDSDLETIRNHIIPADKFCPEPPNYISSDVVKKVVHREMYIPSSSLGCIAASYLLTTAVISELIFGTKIPRAPEYLRIDFISDIFKIGR